MSRFCPWFSLYEWLEGRVLAVSVLKLLLSIIETYRKSLSKFRSNTNQAPQALI